MSIALISNNNPRKNDTKIKLMTGCILYLADKSIISNTEPNKYKKIMKNYEMIINT